MLWSLNGVLGAQASWDYCYYVPHVVSEPEYYWANDAYTHLFVIVTEDGTSYEIDQDADGIYETHLSGLTAGAIEIYERHSRYGGILSIGASIRSDKPLQLILRFIHNHYGTYDACFMFTSLMPTDMWGKEFVVPANSTYLYVFAKSATQVSITPPGQPPITQSIPERTNIKLSSIYSGTTIVADNPVYVLAANCQTDQNYPWMYNVLPIIQLGTDYYHDATYGEYDISWPWPTNPKLWITAVNAATDVYIDENKDGYPEHTYSLGAGESTTYTNPVQGAHIWSNDKIYVVYVENWSQPYRGKYGGAATEYIPTTSYGTSFALLDAQVPRYLPENNPRIFIVASEDNTQVNIDFNWDGTDDSYTLDRGDVWTILWPEGIGRTAHVWSDKAIQVIYRTDKSHPDHPGVNVAYTPLTLMKVIEGVIDIDPDTLNRKSKGRWITAYIELLEGYDVDQINASTVAIVAIDETDIVLPIYAELSPTEIGDYDDDGIPDLMVKFDRKAVIQVVTLGDRTIKITGSFYDGTEFEGSDTIRVIK